jgi:hypothetical protein
MNKGLWIARKNYLFTLIKKVSDFNGGDEIEFLKKHFQETIEIYSEEKIEIAITCYEQVIKCQK